VYVSLSSESVTEVVPVAPLTKNETVPLEAVTPVVLFEPLPK